jgi:prepilin-type N-terminal cleavage/methylation domain-containing protein
MSKRNPGNQDGFSLIEVMVAIVILTVGLLSLAQMMVLATNSNTLSGRMTSCSAIAKEQLERLKAAPFYTDPAALLRNPVLAAGTGSQFYDPDGLPTNGNALFVVNWTITDVPTALPLEMISINVQCSPVSASDRFAVIGNANFTTFRTANVG